MSNANEREKLRQALDVPDQPGLAKAPPPEKGPDDAPRLPVWRYPDGTYGGVISVPCEPHPRPLKAVRLDFRPFARSGFIFLSDDHKVPHPVDTAHVIAIPIGAMGGDPMLYHDKNDDPQLPWHDDGALPSGQTPERPCWWMRFKVIEGTPVAKKFLERGHDKFYLAFGGGFADKGDESPVEVCQVGLFPLDGGDAK